MKTSNDMNHGVKKINTIIAMLLFIPFLKPQYFNVIEGVNYIYYFGMYFSIMIAVIFLLKASRLSLHTIVFFAYQLLSLLTSYLNEISISSVILPIVMNTVLCVLIDRLTQDNARSLLSGLTWLFGILAVTNLILFFIYPDGMFGSIWGDPIHFLEADNKLGPILITVMAFSALYSLYKQNKFSAYTYGIFFVCTLNLILIGSATSVVALIIFLLHIAFMNWNKLSKKLNIRNYIIIIIGLFLIIVIFRLQNYFSFIIEGLFKKDITLTNRIFIWDNAIEIIKNSAHLQILIGNGYSANMLPMLMMGSIYQTHAHNQVLEIVLESGLIGLGVFSLLIIITARKLFKYRNNKMSYVLTGALFSFFLMGLTEKCFYTPFYMVLLISNNIDAIILQHEIYQNEKLKLNNK